MIKLPRISLRRTWLVALRDYLGYVKTWGFWLSFITPILFGAIGLWAGQSDFDFSPPRYETILDETGDHKAGIEARLAQNLEDMEKEMFLALARNLLGEGVEVDLTQAFETGGRDAAIAYLDRKAPGVSRNFEPIKPGLVLIDPPAATIDELKAWMAADRPIDVDGQSIPLSGIVHIRRGADGAPITEYWTTKYNNPKAEQLTRNYFRDKARDQYLAGGGLTAAGLDEARKAVPAIETFDPTKAQIDGDAGGQEVTTTDKIPYFVSAILAFALWLNIFAGSYMLLTSMLEEKMNKLLEMMLATTRFSEIIFGKLLGVAMLTLTAMAPYILLGIATVIGFIFFYPDKEVAAGLVAAFSARTIIFLIVYLILGYIFYGAFFIALGAMSQSMQDAQTLTTPMMLVMTVSLMVVPLGLSNPDSPLLNIASFIPFSAPFAAIIRLPSDPPLWELLLSTAFLAVCCVGVIAIAGRVFRYGVLSGAGVTAVTDWFKRKILRKS